MFTFEYNSDNCTGTIRHSIHTTITTKVTGSEKMIAGFVRWMNQMGISDPQYATTGAHFLRFVQANPHLDIPSHWCNLQPQE